MLCRTDRRARSSEESLAYERAATVHRCLPGQLRDPEWPQRWALWSPHEPSACRSPSPRTHTQPPPPRSVCDGSLVHVGDPDSGFPDTLLCQPGPPGFGPFVTASVRGTPPCTAFCWARGRTLRPAWAFLSGPAKRAWPQESKPSPAGTLWEAGRRDCLPRGVEGADRAVGHSGACHGNRRHSQQQGGRGSPCSVGFPLATLKTLPLGVVPSTR